MEASYGTTSQINAGGENLPTVTTGSLCESYSSHDDSAVLLRTAVDIRTLVHVRVQIEEREEKKARLGKLVVVMTERINSDDEYSVGFYVSFSLPLPPWF